MTTTQWTRRTILAVLALVMSLGAVTTRADDYECRGFCSFGPNAHFDGNIIVTEGSTLVLNGSTVDGNIHVRDRAVLKVRGDAYIGGNIQAAGSRSISVVDSTLGGDFQIDNSGPIDLLRTFVGGSVQLFSNNAQMGLIRLISNTVDGNVQANSNRSAGFYVSFNMIDGNLQGEGNNRRPTGRGNIVQGDTDGQFENF